MATSNARSRVVLKDDVRRILDRAYERRERARVDSGAGGIPYDNCIGCRRIRSEKRQCNVCGYLGPFEVSGCECRETNESNIRFFRERLDGREDDGTGYYSAERMAGELALAEAVTIRQCRCAPPNGHGSPCGHGWTYCPSCGDFEGNDEREELAWALIREIRSLLDR